jgi:Phosphoinositide phospholipase C, Ca2+-dependent
MDTEFQTPSSFFTMKHLLTLIVLALLGAHAQAELEFSQALPDVKINEIQVLGTHNSYAQKVDPKLLQIVDPIFERIIPAFMKKMTPEQAALFREEHPHEIKMTEALSYSHPDLKTQLDSGLRSLEIDVNPDPKGGNFLDPAGYRVLKQQGVSEAQLEPFDTTDLDKPGFKVLHIADIDFRSNCPTLKSCLNKLKSWSNEHAGHVPVFILLEAKTDTLPVLPNPTQITPLTPELFDALDHEILEVLGRDKLVTPDDVLGAYPTLRAASAAKHWPKLSEARGKFIFLMITANGPDSTRMYLNNHPSLQGRVAFLRAMPGEDHAAFLLLDNASVRKGDIQKYVSEGYLVRTRSDIETFEAKVNDPTMAQDAFESGAQVVSTDFPWASNYYGTPYRVSLPGGQVARCNPVVRASCTR